MGTSRTPAELSRKIVRLGAEVSSLNSGAVGAAAQVVKDTTIPYVRRATGGDGVLSGVGKNGAKIGVRYDVRGTVNATALVRATGPAQLVERDVKPHPVVSRYAPRRSRKARAALATSNKSVGAGWDRRAVIRFGNVVARYAVNSGGSRGRHPYRDGFSAGARLAPKAYARHQRQAFVRVFG